MIPARQVRRQGLRVQRFQDAVPGIDKFSPNRASIEGETYEFAGPDPSVVLGHGAHADGSSWSPVIQRLQDAGLAVTTVQNPPTSLADDVAHTRRIVALHETPVILAGHSFASTVISEAGTDPRIAGLVYIAAGAAAVAPEGTRQNRLI
jgi:pimeloyl-ACP methyl ester carboxylesterase